MSDESLIFTYIGVDESEVYVFVTLSEEGITLVVTLSFLKPFRKMISSCLQKKISFGVNPWYGNTSLHLGLFDRSAK